MPTAPPRSHPGPGIYTCNSQSLIPTAPPSYPGPGIFTCSSQAVQVRSSRSPPGRSHHSATFHAPGRSVLVFGGYSGGLGHLNELWTFNLDHAEWWQPETSGGCGGGQGCCVCACVVCVRARVCLCACVWGVGWGVWGVWWGAGLCV